MDFGGNDPLFGAPVLSDTLAMPGNLPDPTGASQSGASFQSVDPFAVLDAQPATTLPGANPTNGGFAGAAYSVGSIPYANLIKAEGGMNPDGSFRTSPKGAWGPAQLMPGTLDEAAKLAGLDPNQVRTDPAANIAAGNAYYGKMRTMFGDDALAAAAYNDGPGNVQKAIAKAVSAGNPTGWFQYLPRETQNYLHTVTGNGAPVPLTNQEFGANDPMVKPGKPAKPQAFGQNDPMVQPVATQAFGQNDPVATPKDQGFLANAWGAAKNLVGSAEIEAGSLYHDMGVLTDAARQSQYKQDQWSVEHGYLNHVVAAPKPIPQKFSKETKEFQKYTEKQAESYISANPTMVEQGAGMVGGAIPYIIGTAIDPALGATEFGVHGYAAAHDAVYGKAIGALYWKEGEPGWKPPTQAQLDHAEVLADRAGTENMALAAGIGLLPGEKIIGGIAGRIAQKYGIKLAEGGVKGFVAQTAAGVATRAPSNAVMMGGLQAAENYTTGEHIMKGVPEAALTGAVAGELIHGATGLGMAGFRAARSRFGKPESRIGTEDTSDQYSPFPASDSVANGGMPNTDAAQNYAGQSYGQNDPVYHPTNEGGFAIDPVTGRPLSGTIQEVAKYATRNKIAGQYEPDLHPNGTYGLKLRPHEAARRAAATQPDGTANATEEQQAHAEEAGATVTPETPHAEATADIIEAEAAKGEPTHEQANIHEAAVDSLIDPIDAEHLNGHIADSATGEHGTGAGAFPAPEHGDIHATAPEAAGAGAAGTEGGGAGAAPSAGTEAPAASLTPTKSGKGVILSNATPEQIAAIKVALPQASPSVQKDGSLSYSAKHAPIIQAVLDGEATPAPAASVKGIAAPADPVAAINAKMPSGYKLATDAVGDYVITGPDGGIIGGRKFAPAGTSFANMPNAAKQALKIAQRAAAGPITHPTDKLKSDLAAMGTDALTAVADRLGMRVMMDETDPAALAHRIVSSYPREAIQRAMVEQDQAKPESAQNSAHAEPGEQPKAEQKPKDDTGAFSDKAAADAWERMKERMKRMHSGIDPEMMVDGMIIAGNFIKNGIKDFAEFARRMREGFGDRIVPYLSSFWESARRHPDTDSEGMTPVAESDEHQAALKREIATMAEQGEPEPETEQGNNEVATLHPVVARLRDQILGGTLPRNIVEVRKIIEEMTGEPIKPGTPQAKRADEMIEAAVVLAAREIVQHGTDRVKIYNELVQVYNGQPNLNVRSSTSIEQQAYSTPVPLAYLAATRAHIGPRTTVYEPSAGNGALLIAASDGNITANELNPDRAAQLRAIYPDATITENDGSTFVPAGGKRDVVIANPPFGPIKGDDGENKVFDLGGNYHTREIDHAISMRALDAMKDNGRAVLIVGSIAKTIKGDKARGDAYNGKAKREFYYRLYSQYNVTDHFTVAGELYSRQGAQWPVDVIVISGRGKSKLPLPAVKPPRVFDSWADLENEVEHRQDILPDAGTGTGEPDQEVTGPASGDAGTGIGGGAGQSDQQQSDLANEQPDGIRPRPAGGQSGGNGLGERTDDLQTGITPAPEHDSGSVSGGRPAEITNEALTEETASQAQVPYNPASDATPLDTLVPINMQAATTAALNRLQARVGSVDHYVADKLGYDPADISRYFSAEQVDALALAIDNMERGAGFIIGDQTGIGKGRVVAGVIRYAIKNGRMPIFVTEKPDLYADMYRDMTDIGLPEMLGRPVDILMTNANETVPLDEEGLATLKTPTVKKHDQTLMRVAQGDRAGVDAVFTNYSQLQAMSGSRTARQEALEAMAPGSILIFDESHNAGGQGVKKRKTKKQKENPNPGMDRAEFARHLAQLAHGVFFSSATYAKRPNVMDLYGSTDMKLAVADLTKLGDAISKGGIPMQQIVAKMLAEAGQYVRRERSFAGIEYRTPSVPVDRNAYAQFANVLHAIQQFQANHIADAVDAISELIKTEAGSISHDGSIGDAGATSTNFTAVMHNLVEQFLLALKAGPAADMAIEALKGGEKPVITLANTMGAFIEEYAAEHGVSNGGELPADFTALLHRYLDRTRHYTVKKPFSDEKGEKHYISDAELGPHGVAAFRAVTDLIRAMDLKGVPVSPIDFIAQRLKDAGYKVREVTGRKSAINYSTKKPTYRTITAAETSISGKRATINGFNGGDVDSVTLNQAGSTGISLHASSKFKDQRPRRMIIVQAERNIDTHMQMLGRVHRTGQVVLPSYDQLVAAVPAEMRPAAVLAKKMASLNANTTGARGSAMTGEDVPDFMNEFGDEIAARLMEEDPELNRRLLYPLGKPDEDENEGALKREDAARKVTGKLTLLPLEDQEAFYRNFLNEYRDYLAEKEATGEATLEAKTLPLDAKVVDRRKIIDATDPHSPFGAAVNLETLDVKRLGKPMKPEAVLHALAEHLGEPVPEGDPDKALLALREKAKPITNAKFRDAMAQFEDYRRSVLDDLTDEKRGPPEKRLNQNAQDFRNVFGTVYPGAALRLSDADGNALYGVVMSVEHKGGTKNPLAMGSYRAKIALADAAAQVTMPFSQLRTNGMEVNEKQRLAVPIDRIERAPVMRSFSDMQTESREQRLMLTGNILAAFDHTNGKGQIVNFIDHDGRMRSGLMMARGYNYAQEQAGQPVALRTPEQVEQWLRMGNKAIGDGVMVEAQNGRLVVTAAASKSEGGRYFLDARVRQALGKDFFKSSKGMTADAPMQNAQDVVAALQAKGANFKATTNLDDARKLVGGDQSSVAESREAYTPQQPITEKQFQNWVAHIDLRARNGGPDSRAEIAQNGFTQSNNVNALPVWMGGQPRNVVEASYMPRAGDTVYLVPPDGYTDGPNGAKINIGWKPGPGQVVKVEYDGQSLYDLYRNALAQDSVAEPGAEAYEPEYEQGANTPAPVEGQSLDMRGRQDAVPARARATLQGLAIPEQFERHKAIALVGQIVTHPHELAQLAQIYRDPRHETLRVFFTKGPLIVHATGASTRSVSSAPLLPDMNGHLPTWHKWLGDTMASTGADGYYLLHNHPSGDPTPSKPDVDITTHTAQYAPGFKGHVIINSHEFATIDARGNTDTFNLKWGGSSNPDPLLTPSKPNPILGEKINDYVDLARLAKQVQRQADGYVTVILTGAKNEVRAVVDMPRENLSKSPTVLMGMLRRYKRISGGERAYLVGNTADLEHRNVIQAVRTGILTEAINEKGNGLRPMIGGHVWLGNRYYRAVDGSSARFIAEDKEPFGAEPPKTGPGAVITRILGQHTDDAGRWMVAKLDKAIPDPVSEILHAVNMGVNPMAEGSGRAQAAAKDFANALRLNAYQWGKVDEFLANTFDPEQRRRMWEAADEQGVLMRRGVEPGPYEGLNRLSPNERATVLELQRRANLAFAEAKKLGMVTGDGLESYVPRMIVEMTASGPKVISKASPRQARRGANLSHTTGQLKQRKYETVEETEAAAQAHFGEGVEVVRDIRTLALATQRLQAATTGRRLVEKIKAISKDAGGGPLVAEGANPDPGSYFTIEHPSLQRWAPKMTTDPETGKVRPLLDENGDMIFEASPIWISREFEGPLNAVLRTPTGPVVRAAMDIKAKMMGVIMYSPFMHNMVIFGKAFPADPVGMLKLIEPYRLGNTLRKDPAMMSEAINAGMVPIGARYFMQDIVGIAAGEGLDIAPGRSWTAQLLALIPGMFSKEAGDETKRAIDKLGDLTHNTLLWDRIADLQAGLYVHIRDGFIANGLDPLTAQRAAAHYANRYAGALPIEALSQTSSNFANLLLFSRSFTLGNIGAFKDLLAGLPSDVRAQIERDSGPAMLEHAQGLTRRKAIGMFMMEKALQILSTMAAVGAMAWLFNHVYQNPAENEPEKQSRFLIRYQDDGTAIYGRLPLGKVAEDWGDWLTEPRQTFLNKQSPYARLGYAIASGDAGFGRKLYDPQNNLKGAEHDATNIAWLAMTGVAPTEQIEGFRELAEGTAPDKTTAWMQAFLPVTGITISTGAPGGPARGDLLRFNAEVQYQMQQQRTEIVEKIRSGDLQGARKQMTDIGLPPQLQNAEIRATLNPSARMSAHQIRNFMLSAPADDRAKFEADREAASARKGQ